MRVSVTPSLAQVLRPSLNSVHVLCSDVHRTNAPDRRRSPQNGQARKRTIVWQLDRYTNVHAQENFPPRISRLNYIVKVKLSTIMEKISPLMPPDDPWTLSNSRKAIAAPCLDSQFAENRSTSRRATIPCHTQPPGMTSSACDCCAAFGDTAPPLEGSMTTFSGGHVLISSGLSTRDLGASCASADTSRALRDQDSEMHKKMLL
jgi:hypothetical protein